MINTRCTLVLNASRFLTQCRARHKFAYEGNPFETKINMKRQVKDPSYPNFNEQECLKWSNWRMLRDVKRRYISADYWQERNNMKSIAKCRTLPSVVRDMAKEDHSSVPRDAQINRLINRCALSSRARGKFIRYRLSRIIWRDMADHGMLSGYIRAKWG